MAVPCGDMGVRGGAGVQRVYLDYLDDLGCTGAWWRHRASLSHWMTWGALGHAGDMKMHRGALGVPR